MQILDESDVLESEIDSLGHMNVRFYLSRVDRANRALLEKLGILSGLEGAVVRRQDTYSRFRREQFAGLGGRQGYSERRPRHRQLHYGDR